MNNDSLKVTFQQNSKSHWKALYLKMESNWTHHEMPKKNQQQLENSCCLHALKQSQMFWALQYCFPCRWPEVSKISFWISASVFRLFIQCKFSAVIYIILEIEYNNYCNWKVIFSLSPWSSILILYPTTYKTILLQFINGTLFEFLNNFLLWSLYLFILLVSKAISFHLPWEGLSYFFYLNRLLPGTGMLYT